ncbi:5'-nucleotidase C-terminal domain-containing protein [Flavobacteriaceae bacterium AH-315-B10]|nr:5'-nucleotidase C-terminal domain-containing protein [Flavobacteriaceae bacterium AH-315-B10]
MCLFSSCKQETYLSKIEGKRIEINDTLPSNQAIEDYIKPYKEHVEKDLDSVLAYAVDTYSKNDGELNTAIGNFMADAVFELSNPIFKSRTGKDIDMVLLNHGGIRSIISKGNITSGTAYKIMPFDNIVVVAELKGTYVLELVKYLQNAKRAHPISKLNIKLDSNFELIEATINNKPIDANKTYYVATNDYLMNGGDRMTFLRKRDSLYVLDYKIRNLLIDYFKKVDTINPVIDDRFIQIK